MCRVGARPGTAGGRGAGNELCTPVTTNQPTSDTGGSTTKKSCHRSTKFVFAGPPRRGGACVVDEMPPWLTRPPLGADPPAPEAHQWRRQRTPAVPKANRPAQGAAPPAPATDRLAPAADPLAPAPDALAPETHLLAHQAAPPAQTSVPTLFNC